MSSSPLPLHPIVAGTFGAGELLRQNPELRRGLTALLGVAAVRSSEVGENRDRWIFVQRPRLDLGGCHWVTVDLCTGGRDLAMTYPFVRSDLDRGSMIVWLILRTVSFRKKSNPSPRFWIVRLMSSHTPSPRHLFKRVLMLL